MRDWTCCSTTSIVVRTRATVCLSVIWRMTQRGAEEKRAAGSAGSSSSSASHVTNPSMPARAMSVIHERYSGSRSRNQAWRASISASVAVVMTAVWLPRRLTIAARVRDEGTSVRPLTRCVALVFAMAAA